MRRRLLFSLLTSAVVLVAAGVPAGADGMAVPGGFSATGRTELAPGVEHVTLRRAGVPLIAHVAHIAPGAKVSVRGVLSNGAVAEDGERLERTSSMCARVHCIAAVNGDFALPGADQPVGGFVAGGVLQRTPVTTHHQLSIAPDGKLTAGALAWTGKLAALDLTDVAITGVNVERGDDALVAYTNAWGATTLTNQFGVELAGHVVGDDPIGTLGETVTVEFDAFHDGASNDAAGNTPIPANGVVFSGHGKSADALRDFWNHVETGTDRRALLRFDAAAPELESIGGTPILLKDGKRWFADDGANFIAGRHPRTVVGWNPNGDTFMVTIDGRQPGTSEGATLAEAADFMAGLGATDAINLDGGGSTTFVVGGGAGAGGVANQPSDTLVRHAGKTEIVHQAAPRDTVLGRVERPVVSALAIVADTPGPRPARDPLAHVDLRRPQAIKLTSSYAGDPASIPGAKLPGLIARPSGEPAREVVALAVAVNLMVALALSLGAGRHRGWPPTRRCRAAR
jgi:hypothetical protein